jgi:hypothetical protein
LRIKTECTARLNCADSRGILKIGRGERIRTSDPSVPNRVLYQTEPRPDRRMLRLGSRRPGTADARTPILTQHWEFGLTLILPPNRRRPHGQRGGNSARRSERDLSEANAGSAESSAGRNRGGMLASQATAASASPFCAHARAAGMPRSRYPRPFPFSFSVSDPRRRGTR